MCQPKLQAIPFVNYVQIKKTKKDLNLQKGSSCLQRYLSDIPFKSTTSGHLTVLNHKKRCTKCNRRDVQIDRTFLDITT